MIVWVFYYDAWQYVQESVSVKIILYAHNVHVFGMVKTHCKCNSQVTIVSLSGR